MQQHFVFNTRKEALPHIKCACLLPLDGIHVLPCSTEKTSLKHEVNEDGSVVVSAFV